MIPRRVRLAMLIAMALNAGLVLTTRYRLSYDAYTHMLFADHYRTAWWSLWDAKWFTGFNIVSYPPLVHQVMALFGQVIGVDAAFGLVLWLVMSVYPLAVYAFSRVFVSEKAAGYAAGGAAVLPSLYLAAFTFGQLPTLTSALFALLSAAALAEYLIMGKRISAALAVGLTALVMAAHHATLLFLPGLYAAVALHLLLSRQVTWQVGLLRLAGFSLFTAGVGLLVIWPFWQWGAGQVMQTPIDHLSRHNFLTDQLAALIFFWAIYGPLALVIPYAIWQGRKRHNLGLASVFLVYFLLGLGGTTPLPRWLFGAGWEWLTYDRFALWATLLLLPFLGMVVERVWLPQRRDQALGVLGFYAFLGVIALLGGLYPTVIPTQPKPVDIQPVLSFLASGDNSQWRYVTFGFGDQFAYLNRLSSATTLDGSYFTARSVPVLRASGIGQIDSAFWLTDGLDALDPILQQSGAYGVRWGFLNDAVYIPVLTRNGWRLIETLADHVQVWEDPQATLPAPADPPVSDPLAVVSWGTLPLLVLGITSVLAGMRLRPLAVQRVLYGAHTLAVGLLPLGLVFWYFHSLTTFQNRRIYFTYDNALLFLSDGLMIVAVLAWALGRLAGGTENKAQETVQTNAASDASPITRSSGWTWLRSALLSMKNWFLALCILSSLSILWSQDRQVSVYISLHLWLIFALFLSLRDRPATWFAAALGMTAALASQAVVGFWEYAVQSTAFLAPLNMPWPGTLFPAVRGVSVVQLLDGARWLRVYGTTPHPNILGSLIAGLLCGPALLWFLKPRLRLLAAVLFCAGLGVLILTFSRGAWVGVAAGGIYLIFKLRRLELKWTLLLGMLSLVTLAAVIVPVRGLIFTRIAETSVVRTEVLSIEARTWLVERAWMIIQMHPLQGGGIGAFIEEIKPLTPRNFTVEPVHDLPLLVISDLGVGGLLILLGMSAVILAGLIRSRSPAAILFSAALLALLVTSLFDHSLWTLAPGRVALGLFMGLWAGQVDRR